MTRCLEKAGRWQLLRSDMRYWMRQITPQRAAEVLAGIALFAAALVGLPIIAALLMG